MTTVDDREMDERECYKVAVTVFCTAIGVDRLDASHRAVSVIRHALGTVGEYEGSDGFHIEVDGSETKFAPQNHYIVLNAYEVMDTGAAMANGYFMVDPSSRPYRHKE